MNTASRKRFRMWLIIAAAIVMVLALGAIPILIASPFAFAPQPEPVSAPAGGPPPLPYPSIPMGTAQYEVYGDGPALKIQYIVIDEDASKIDVPLPWTKSSAAPWMSLTAQRGGGPGNITCRITGYGRVLDEDKASGPYSSCSATAFQDKRENDEILEEEGETHG